MNECQTLEMLDKEENIVCALKIAWWRDRYVNSTVKKGMTEDEMAGWHHRLDGHEFG